MASKDSWNNHYTRDRSSLLYPDENLVRLMSKYSEKEAGDTYAVDLGCGSGRHLKLLMDFGINNVIGTDISYNALDLTRKVNSTPVVQSNNMHIPFKDNFADYVIAWGSLHYNMKDDLPAMINEIHRILKKGGHLFATLRTDRDSCIKRGSHRGNNIWITDLEDIEGSTVSLYSEKELPGIFEIYSTCTIGLIERTIMGDLNSTISHWVIHAEK